MSIQALRWSLEVEKVSSSQKFVLIALANFAGETGLAYPAIATICRLTCQTDSTVRRALSDLLLDKIIIDTGKRVGNTKQVAVYQLPDDACERYAKSHTFEKLPKTVEGLSKDHRKTIERLANLGTNPVTSNPETVKDTPSADADMPSDAEITEMALKIYQLYPRKVARPKAVKKIAKQIKTHGFEFVRQRTEAFSKIWLGGDLQFCPHAATWFEQERFNDSPETWSATVRPTKQSHSDETPKISKPQMPTNF